MTYRRASLRLAVPLFAALLTACPNSDSPSGAGPGTEGASTAGKATSSVTPTGKVITVEMYTDGQGNYFKPNKLEAGRGDVIRFTLKSGVHNVNFLPDSNPSREGLPAASELLQLPDQSWDYLVAVQPGSYYFQCDPHALLGMVGRLEVK
jgi:plastocyanin